MICMILPLLVFSTGFSEDPDGGWMADKLEWAGVQGITTTLEIINEYGDVRARGYAEPEISVSAVVQKWKDDPYKLVFMTEKLADRTVIRVAYAGDENDTVKGHGKRRADMTVLVPYGMRFEVTTFKGLIEAKGLQSDVQLTSDRGKIFLKTDGRPEVFNRQGQTIAFLKEANWKEAAIFESVVGDIEVHLPQDADLLVETSTAGELTTDYSVELARSDSHWTRHGLVRLGKVTHQLKLTSKEGNIKLIEGRWQP